MSDTGTATEKPLFGRPWIFIRGVPAMKFLPPEGPPEIAFAGRSNVGKSSLINALVGHKGLARTSNTPGRTQELNYFVPEGYSGEAGDLPPMALVDMPGYGYAQVPEAIRTHWVKLLGDYLQQRRQLIGLVLIMDARHPLKELDLRMLDFFHITGRPVHILLSKADKLSKNEQIKTRNKRANSYLD